MATLISLAQNFSTTLNVGGGIDNSQTTGIILTSVSGLPTAGLLCFDWASPIDTTTYEYIEYTGITGNELTGVTRGSEGVSAKQHANACTIVGIISKSHINRINDKLTSTDTTLVTDPHGNEIIKTSHNDSAVNEITVTNAATGNAPSISATGGDSNIDLSLAGKGTGKVKIDANYGAYTSNTDAATITFNLATSNMHTVTLGGNRTLALSNPSTGQCFVLNLLQDATGSRTVTWFATIRWAGGVAPTLTTTGNKRDTFGFIVTSAGNYDGFVVGQNL